MKKLLIVSMLFAISLNSYSGTLEETTSTNIHRTTEQQLENVEELKQNALQQQLKAMKQAEQMRQAAELRGRNELMKEMMDIKIPVIYIGIGDGPNLTEIVMQSLKESNEIIQRYEKRQTIFRILAFILMVLISVAVSLSIILLVSKNKRIFK